MRSDSSLEQEEIIALCRYRNQTATGKGDLDVHPLGKYRLVLSGYLCLRKITY
ncbi:hypothetical protein ACS91J_08995 [Pectobacterium carotovorum]